MRWLFRPGYWLFGVVGVVGALGAADYRIAVIPKGTTHEFWKTVHAGVAKARREWAAEGVGLELLWNGPLREDDREQQIQLVETFTVRGVDGMVLAPLDASALVLPVERAVRSGVPVVVMDSALQSSAPVSYVATDNVAGGRMAARFLAERLGGRGRVITVRYQAGSASNEERVDGFVDEMTSAHPGIELLVTNQYAGVTLESALRTAQNLVNRYGRELDGVFCCNAPVTVGMHLALKQGADPTRRIRLVGFDANEELVAALRRGEVEGLVLQDPLRIGYEAVGQLVRCLRGEPVTKRVDTGVYLITRENLGEARVQSLLNPPLGELLN